MNRFDELKNYIEDLKSQADADAEMYYKNKRGIYKNLETLIAITNAKSVMCDLILQKMDKLGLDNSIKS